MALQVIAKTSFKNPELKKLSQAMAASQKEELQQLRALARMK